MASFTIRDKATGEETALIGTFTPDEWSTLEEFDTYAGDLFGLRVFMDPTITSVSLNWTQEEGLSGTATLPLEDDLLAMLHRLRPFVLQKERTNFFVVCNIIRRRIRHPLLDHTLDLTRKIYSGQRMQADIRLASGDSILNSHTTLVKWLNAFEYHRDQEKQNELRRFLATFGSNASRGVIVLLLFEMADAIFKLGQVLRALRGTRGPGPLEVDFESARSHAPATARARSLPTGRSE